jgi:uridine phosphorylase
MQIPQFLGKHDLESLLTPEAFLQYLKEGDRLPPQTPPKGVIICYHNSLFNFVKENHKTTQGEKFFQMLHFLDESDGQVAITHRFGIGSPAAAAVMEELIAWGVKKFVSVGTAGTLQKDIAIGDLVLCDRAIRDEGTSFHYIPPSKYAESSTSLTLQLENELKAKNLRYTRGTSWTVDAIYRETIAEARQYQAEGVATVEMEASALFAVGAHRNVDVAAIFSVSDSLANLKWEPHFHSDKTQQGLESIFQAAMQAILKS